MIWAGRVLGRHPEQFGRGVTLMAPATPLLYVSFVLLVAAVGGLLLLVAHGAPTKTFRPSLPFMAWVALAALGATTGVLTFGPVPSILLFFLVGFILTILLARSSFGAYVIDSVPLWGLVGYQAFRIPVELLLHRAWIEGLAPVRMTYAGLNYDIITGITALVLGVLLVRRRIPNWVLWLWNVGGLGLLIAVVTVAILSSPTPLQVFYDEPTNVWVSAFPWIWLPTVLVPAALFGHALVFRMLMGQRHVEPQDL